MSPAAFIAAHTTIDTTLSVSDECPICLDNYTHEACLQITEIAGCSHHIGQTCLEEMLKGRPAEEKKCPLCRTTWIAAPAGPRNPPRPNNRPRAWQQIISNQDTALLEQARSSHQARAAHNGGANQALRAEATPDEPSVRPRSYASYAILLESDSEPENYADLTRDIESVRARARETQVSRSQRRQALRARTPQAGRGEPRAGEHASLVAAASNGGPRPRLFLNPFRQSNPPVVGAASRLIPAPAPRPDYPVRMSSLRQPVNPSGGILSRRVADVSAVPGPPRLNSDDPEFVTSLDPPRANADVPHTSPGTTSSDSMISDTVELPGLDLYSARRAHLLDKREAALNIRDAELSKRELSLTAHEAVQSQASKAPVQRQGCEQREDTLLRVMQKQQKEREDLAKKQKEELEMFVREAATV